MKGERSRQPHSSRKSASLASFILIRVITPHHPQIYLEQSISEAISQPLGDNLRQTGIQHLRQGFSHLSRTADPGNLVHHLGFVIR
jgi:hypothetical protein